MVKDGKVIKLGMVKVGMVKVGMVGANGKVMVAIGGGEISDVVIVMAGYIVVVVAVGGVKAVAVVRANGLL